MQKGRRQKKEVTDPPSQPMSNTIDDNEEKNTLNTVVPPVNDDSNLSEEIKKENVAPGSETTRIAPVADMEKISFFRTDPKIEAHIGQGIKTTGANQQQGQQPVITPGTPAPGKQNPTPNPNDFGGTPFTKTPPSEPIPITPTVDEPVDVSRKKAEKQFNWIVRKANNIVTTYGPMLTDAKVPSTIIVLDSRPDGKEFADGINAAVKRHNDKMIEPVKLSQEEIEEIREPAIQVIMESGRTLSAKEMLFISLGTILLNKAKGIGYAMMQRNSVKEDIQNEINRILSQLDARHGFHSGFPQFNAVVEKMQHQATEFDSRMNQMNDWFEKFKNNSATKVNYNDNGSEKPAEVITEPAETSGSAATPGE